MEAGNNGAAKAAIPRHAALAIYEGTLRPQAAKITSLATQDNGEVKLTLDTPTGSIEFLQTKCWFDRSMLIAQAVEGEGASLVGGYLVEYEDGTAGWWSAAKFEASFRIPQPEPEPEPLPEEQVLNVLKASFRIPLPEPEPEPAKITEEQVIDQLVAMLEGEQKDPTLACVDNEQLLLLLKDCKLRFWARNAKRQAKAE